MSLLCGANQDEQECIEINYVLCDQGLHVESLERYDSVDV
jgi:hypothetical protein